MIDDFMIRVVDLTIGWDQTVLQKNATFDVARGEVFAILGGSGCGKSTLLRYLVGLEDPIAGSVTVAGIGAPHLEVGKPPFGVMFQSGALIGSLTVGENVALPLEEWTDLSPEAVGAIVRAKLRLVGLKGVMDMAPSELSGGMKKRAAIARAMALEPNLMFLDEPSAGLDPVSAVELDEPDPDAQPATGVDGRRRDPRAAEHLQDRLAVHHARQGESEHHRPWGPARASR